MRLAEIVGTALTPAQAAARRKRQAAAQARLADVRAQSAIKIAAAQRKASSI